MLSEKKVKELLKKLKEEEAILADEYRKVRSTIVWHHALLNIEYNRAVQKGLMVVLEKLEDKKLFLRRRESEKNN